MYLEKPNEVKTEMNLTEILPLALFQDDNVEFPATKDDTLVAVVRKLDENSLLNELTGIYHCNECEYETKTSLKIRQHIQTIHERRYKCEHCEYASKSKSHVQSHMITKHTGVRYNCDKCNFQTAHKKSVARHLEGKHNADKKNKKYKCDLCHFKTFDELNLRGHKRKTHDIYTKEVYYKMAQLKKISKDL